MMMQPDLTAAQVGVNYDPMIAKVIARGPDRNTALARLHRALSDLQVSSVLLLTCLLPCCLEKKENRSLHFSAKITGASQNGRPELLLSCFSSKERLTSCTKVIY